MMAPDLLLTGWAVIVGQWESRPPQRKPNMHTYTEGAYKRQYWKTTGADRSRKCSQEYPARRRNATGSIFLATICPVTGILIPISFAAILFAHKNCLEDLPEKITDGLYYGHDVQKIRACF